MEFQSFSLFGYIGVINITIYRTVAKTILHILIFIKRLFRASPHSLRTCIVFEKQGEVLNNIENSTLIFHIKVHFFATFILVIVI